MELCDGGTIRDGGKCRSSDRRKDGGKEKEGREVRMEVEQRERDGDKQ